MTVLGQSWDRPEAVLQHSWVEQSRETMVKVLHCAPVEKGFSGQSRPPVGPDAG